MDLVICEDLMVAGDLVRGGAFVIACSNDVLRFGGGVAEELRAANLFDVVIERHACVFLFADLGVVNLEAIIGLASCSHRTESMQCNTSCF